MAQLVIDIGNTEAKSGLFDGERFLRLARPDEPADVAIIGSVSPQKEKSLVGEIRTERILFAGRDLPPPIPLKVKRPEKVGADRIANAIAGFKRTGGATVVVDFGTALTLDVIGDEGEFIGGVISPGVSLSLWALSTRTALLPVVGPAPAPIIGTDTTEAMRSGAINGLAKLADGMVEAIEQELGKKLCVIATGGEASLVGPLLRTVDEIVCHLTLEGLNLWYLNSSHR